MQKTKGLNYDINYDIHNLARSMPWHSMSTHDAVELQFRCTYTPMPQRVRCSQLENVGASDSAMVLECNFVMKLQRASSSLPAPMVKPALACRQRAIHMHDDPCPHFLHLRGRLRDAARLITLSCKCAHTRRTHVCPNKRSCWHVNVTCVTQCTRPWASAALSLPLA